MVLQILVGPRDIFGLDSGFPSCMIPHSFLTIVSLFCEASSAGATLQLHKIKAIRWPGSMRYGPNTFSRFSPHHMAIIQVNQLPSELIIESRQFLIFPNL